MEGWCVWQHHTTSSCHPCRPPLGARLKTAGSPACSVVPVALTATSKLGRSLTLTGNMYGAGQRALHPEGPLRTQKACRCWGDMRDAESRGCPG